MSEVSVYQQWPAPAKLNLMLRIIGRRADGYHLLQTVFQFIDRCDFLDFEILKDSRIELKTPLAGVPPETDLTVRAARLLQESAGVRKGVRISVHKRLPMGGGLGGGSSDAATVLMALNYFWEVGLTEETLIQLGVRLGADVPVFIKGRSAWAEGVGETLTPLDLPQPWYVIVIPPCHVSTREIFSDPDLTRNSNPVKIKNFLEGMEANDCLPVVRDKYPQVKQALSELSQFGNARLTGTGACVFSAFPTKGQALEVKREMAKKWQAMVAQGRNLSPLHEKLAQLR